MSSTDLKPLAYFQYIIDSNNLLDVIEKEFHYSDCIGFELTTPTEIKYTVENSEGSFEQKSILTKDLLYSKLYREFEIAKNNLYSFSLNNSKLSIENYLTIQFNSLQTILNEKSDFINNHIYFMLPLRGILKYINTILLLPEMKEFELDESKISYNLIDLAEQASFESTKKSDIETIHSIFDYMKGNNEKREKILSDEDFQLLIKYTTELIKLESVPQIDKQLYPKISNDLLRFSFWVLHKELYTTKRIRKYFYDFVKVIFLNFKDSDTSSIESQFGTSTRVKKDKFIPQIISKHL
ncbi:hypothetical protein [Flavobacterium sp.]|uniref:hypothetical protein n=1 Tax=Flavobacterium sp. TaxID=239 RepID=UPI003D0E3A1C